MIPRATIERAANILISQPFVPLSPAVEDSRGVYLCAAAALALAGIERQDGNSAANEFRQAVSSMATADLENVYMKLGWQPDICRTMRQCNDTSLPEHRLSAVIESLSHISTV